MVSKLETEYRIRWRLPSTAHHRTRYYSRRHHALNAAERYRARGCVVDFDERPVMVLGSWVAISEEVATSAQAPAVAKLAAITCRHCSQAITQPSGFTIWSTGGARGHICPGCRMQLHEPA